MVSSVIPSHSSSEHPGLSICSEHFSPTPCRNVLHSDTPSEWNDPSGQVQLGTESGARTQATHGSNVQTSRGSTPETERYRIPCVHGYTVPGLLCCWISLLHPCEESRLPPVQYGHPLHHRYIRTRRWSGTDIHISVHGCVHHILTLPLQVRGGEEQSSLYFLETVFWWYVLLIHTTLVVSLTSPVDIFDTVIVVIFTVACLMYLCRPRGSANEGNTGGISTSGSQGVVLVILVTCSWMTFSSIPQV